MDQNQRDYDELDRPRRRSVDGSRWRRGLRSAVVPLLVLGIIAAFMIGFCAGGLVSTRQVYHSRYERDRDVLAPVLAADPAFSKVRIHPNSGGGVELGGEVPTTADGTRLRAEFVRLFGETQAWRISVLVGQTGQLVPNQSHDVPATR